MALTSTLKDGVIKVAEELGIAEPVKKTPGPVDNSLDLKVYQADYNQRVKDAAAAQKQGLAQATSVFNQEKANVELVKKQQTAELAAQLKNKSLTKAEHAAALKEVNASYASKIKDVNALKATLTNEAKAAYTTAFNDAKTFLADSKAAIATEQKRLKDQFETQKKLAAQSQKEALANLAFERALYTKADYDKKVAGVKGDFGRINEALGLSYKTVQTLPAERREEYLAGGIGSLAKAQELLAKYKETSVPAGAPGRVTVPTTPRVTPPVTTGPVTTPGTPPVTTDPVTTPVTTDPVQEQEVGAVRIPSAQLRKEAQEGMQKGIRSPIATTEGIGTTIPTTPTTPTAPTTPIASPGGVFNPYEGVFGGKQQFPYLENPYMSMFPGMQPPAGQQPPMAQPPVEPPAGQPPPMASQPQSSSLLFNPAYVPPTTGLQLSQTPPPPSAPVDYMQFLQNNPYLTPYQGMAQPQEQQPAVAGAPVERPFF